MRVKKLTLLSVLVLMLSITMTGCGYDGAYDISFDNTSKNQSMNSAKEAYTLLYSSAEMIDTMGSGIVGAWGYSIEHCNDEYGSFSGLSKVCGLTSEEVNTAFSQYKNDIKGRIGENMFLLAEHTGQFTESKMLQDFNDVLGALIPYGYTPYMEDIQKDLDKANALIRSVDQDESYYTDLIDYYTAVSNYFEFCKNPTGNYQTANSTIKDYSEKMNTAKSKLSFYLE